MKTVVCLLTMMMLAACACGSGANKRSEAQPAGGEPVGTPAPPDQAITGKSEEAPDLWEAVGPDGTRYLLENGASPRLVPFDGVRAGAGESCVEVVGMEADAMLVRLGTMTDGKCVLSETVLRFARQTQR